MDTNVLKISVAAVFCDLTITEERTQQGYNVMVLSRLYKRCPIGLLVVPIHNHSCNPCTLSMHRTTASAVAMGKGVVVKFRVISATARIVKKLELGLSSFLNI
jgi:hypothetical protein